MRILVDTHTLIWYLNGNPALSKKVRELIDDNDNLVVISVVSLWEIVMKLSSGKLEIKIQFEDIEAYLASRNFKLIGIGFEHLKISLKLPYHHGDPFDRMLIAQAIDSNLVIASVDKEFKAYPVALIS